MAQRGCSNGVVEAVLRIEGVASNSLEIVHEYLFQTNQFPFANIGDRTYLCHDLVGKVFSDSSLNGYRSRVLEMALDFETNVNIAPNLVDMAIECRNEPNVFWYWREVNGVSTCVSATKGGSSWE